MQVKATDGHEPRQVGRQFVIDRRSALWIALSREQAGRLVIAEQAGGRGLLHWIAVHCDAVKRFQQRGGRGDDFTIAGEPPFSDPSLDFPEIGSASCRERVCEYV